MGRFRRVFFPTPEEEKEDIKKFKKLWDEGVKKRGCITCANCIHVISYPGFVTAEECECQVGLECDTVLGTITNCEKYVERDFFEGDKDE